MWIRIDITSVFKLSNINYRWKYGTPRGSYLVNWPCHESELQRLSRKYKSFLFKHLLDKLESINYHFLLRSGNVQNRMPIPCPYNQTPKRQILLIKITKVKAYSNIYNLDREISTARYRKKNPIQMQYL